MATDIQLKRSFTAGSVPVAGNVLVGEPVVNLTDKVIFSKDGNGNVVVIGAGTTSNVIEGSNLYFSNTRAVAAVSPYLTTANIIEAVGFVGEGYQYAFTDYYIKKENNVFSQYYINHGSTGWDTYVLNSVAVGHAVYATIRDGGGFNPGPKLFYGIVTSVDTSTTGAVDGSRKFTVSNPLGHPDFYNFANYDKRDTLFEIYRPSDTAIMYFTNARAVAAVTPYLNTSNVTEGTNLYFNNARARAAFTAGTNITIADGVISSTASGNNNNFEFDYGFIYDATISTVISPIDYGSI